MKNTEVPLSNFIERLDRKMRNMKIIFLLVVPVLVFMGLNFRQLYLAWAIKSETRRLANFVTNTTADFQNPAPVEENFDGTLSTEFWKFSIINGAGKVSNENAWHSASMTLDDGLTIHHFPDPEFENESAEPKQPAAERYNNLTLIGGSGFQPTPSSDVVLRFSASASENFYGSAGVVFQPEGTLQPDGMFVKPFDMFGYAIIGEESSFRGTNGTLCYLALNWAPVQVEPLQADYQALHEYEIRLQWNSETQWLGIVKVDGAVQCQMPMPAFGPMEVHVWSDNVLLVDTPRRWWEISPMMDMKHQDGGEKQFNLKSIQIFEEQR